MAEYLVGSGQQVFMMSWRNPDARHAKWGFDTYGQAVLDAMDAVERVTRSEQVALMGTCSGGINGNAPNPPAEPGRRTGARRHGPFG